VVLAEAVAAVAGHDEEVGALEHGKARRRSGLGGGGALAGRCFGGC
jgi:hypothetical protein